MTCFDGWNWGEPDGACPDCGSPTVDGASADDTREEIEKLFREMRNQ